MIGYVGVDEQVDRDFHRALRTASLHPWRDKLLRRSAQGRVVSFDEAKGALARWSQVYRGMWTVEVEKIVGSVGRSRDFDESFLPVKVSMSGRWAGSGYLLGLQATGHRYQVGSRSPKPPISRPGDSGWVLTRPKLEQPPTKTT